jgi:acyl-CoA thioesterase FadM
VRVSSFEVVSDTGHFTPLQLQPRAILATAFNGLARWLREHLVSFPRLIAEHRTSVVILSAGISYGRELRFFDADAYVVATTLKLLRQASRAQLDVELSGPHGVAATARILLCPVRIEDPDSLAATPAAFDARLIERFHPDEIDPASPARPLAELTAGLGQGLPIATQTERFVVHRHLCEVADQWAFYEVPGLIGAGREALVRRCGATTPALRRALSSPLRRLELELQRPYFWFQPGTVETTAHVREDRLVFVHRLLSDVPGGEQHGIAIEQF